MLLDNNDLDKFSSTSEMFKGEEYYQTFSSFSKECLESIPENLMLFDRTDFQSDPKPTSSTTSSGPEFHLPKKSRKGSLSEAFKRTREIYLQKMNEAKLLESARCYEASPLNESAESLPQSVMLIDSSDPQSATGPQCSSFAAFTPGLEVQYKNNIPSHMITDNFPFD
ncbi:hypothetical protein NPIL_234861 [Nephila pilipes]|uniref:Uncharacterized protein n=1 Tax=Nephila pilipes TaxID=299642 RepID=A0A8X6QQB2_NEPPI|nr:hypothetical protein NPIL_234861 [Nephila pilipes]